MISSMLQLSYQREHRFYSDRHPVAEKAGCSFCPSLLVDEIGMESGVCWENLKTNARDDKIGKLLVTV